uniref:Uncharacterized protein n=1 Tax=Daphnia magna TaxID=35525 RepID=A0A0P6IPE7_9CRUS
MLCLLKSLHFSPTSVLLWVYGNGTDGFANESGLFSRSSSNDCFIEHINNILDLKMGPPFQYAGTFYSESVIYRPLASSTEGLQIFHAYVFPSPPSPFL